MMIDAMMKFHNVVIDKMSQQTKAIAELNATVAALTKKNT